MKKEKIILYLVVPLSVFLLFGFMAFDQFYQAADFADPRHSGPNETAALDQGSININTANAELLDTLPGIGPKLAARIIAYREANGPFQSIYELSNVEGLGAQTIIKMIELIRLEDPK